MCSIEEFDFTFYDIFTKNEEEKEIEVPEELSDRFENVNEEIGRGAYSIVYHAKNKMDSKLQCVCKIVYYTDKITKRDFNELCQEPIILETLDHNNIIKVEIKNIYIDYYY